MNPIHNNTNVPATLDQIIDILPGMPSELQLHPVKLKCKLEYKSHYMYDMIHSDHVICAITWLKEHNFPIIQTKNLMNTGIVHCF